ncbi:hypothetical protein [Hymenobacter jeollabukensis]|uniref:Uncharacterized protein n=1 Tax=Hymenobacter jeollabukensis TaxID=2025313 RepID=A0A5R8WQT2_9BACT|nr:hypothetical protein [Hymenobacter jeollabukensis]TLM93114.1 hypothetical protein FDY95_10805 [Hymenobacter jeollabukensis]
MRQLLRPAFSVLLVLGLSTASHAQVGLIMAAARLGVAAATLANADMQYTCKGPGSYQLNSADWQPAPIVLTNGNLTAGKGKEAKQFGLEEVRQVVVRTDTFVVVRNVKFPGANAISAAPTLGRRTWRHAQVELFNYYAAAGALPMLRFPDGKVLVLPIKPKEYRAAMLKLVGDQPKLAEQLRGNELEPVHTRLILDTYLRWKPTGFDTTASFANEQPGN